MKIGASLLLNFTKTTIEDFIKKSAERKFEVVEIVVEYPYCIPNEIPQNRRENIKKLAEELSISLTIHATFSDINLATVNEVIRNNFISEIKNSIDLANDFGSKYVTIHPGTYGALGMTYPHLTRKHQIESLRVLCDYAKERDILIGYENMPIMPSSQPEEVYNPECISKLLKEIDCTNLRFTWDVGHSHTTNFKLEDFSNELNSYLNHLHIHDNLGPINGWSDTHLELGKGNIEWRTVFKILKDQNYSNTIVFELNTWEKIDRSMEFLKSIIF